MKRMLVSAALLLSGFASALSPAQREEHLREVFAAANIAPVACPALKTVTVRLCGTSFFNDSLIRDSWDAYARSSSRVTFTAIHASPWKASADGAAYISTFVVDDADTYDVVVSAGGRDNYVIASWSGGTPAAGGTAAGGAVAATPPASAKAPAATAPAAPVSAAPDLSRPKSECDPGAISVNNIGGSGWVSARWYQEAVFPNPAYEYTRGASDKVYTQSCPNFEVAFDPRKGEYTFRGKTFDDVLNYGGLGRYPNSPSISLIDHSNFLQIAQIGLTYDRTSKTFKTVGDNTADFNLTAMGYRVDGGALQPLFFQGKISAMVVPAGAKVLEVYAQPSVYTGWQYLKVDIVAGALTAQRTYPFPAK